MLICCVNCAWYQVASIEALSLHVEFTAFQGPFPSCQSHTEPTLHLPSTSNSRKAQDPGIRSPRNLTVRNGPPDATVLLPHSQRPTHRSASSYPLDLPPRPRDPKPPPSLLYPHASATAPSRYHPRAICKRCGTLTRTRKNVGIGTCA